MSWVTPITHTTGDPIVVSDFNTYVNGNTNYLYGNTGWTSLAGTLVNSWSASSGTFVGCRRAGTMVFLRGWVQGGANNTQVLTLPSGYYPVYTWNGPVQTPGVGSAYLCAINPSTINGELDLFGFSGTPIISLDGVSFSIV